MVGTGVGGNDRATITKHSIREKRVSLTRRRATPAFPLFICRWRCSRMRPRKGHPRPWIGRGEKRGGEGRLLNRKFKSLQSVILSLNAATAITVQWLVANASGKIPVAVAPVTIPLFPSPKISSPALLPFLHPPPPPFLFRSLGRGFDLSRGGGAQGGWLRA